MTWETYYDKFYDWAESTAVSHLSRLTDFGPSAEVCEIAQMFSEAAANRLIRKALASGVRFTAEEIGELDGVVAESLMPQLVQTTSTPLTAEVLSELSDWLNGDQLRTIARQNGITVDAYTAGSAGKSAAKSRRGNDCRRRKFSFLTDGGKYGTVYWLYRIQCARRKQNMLV